MPRKANPTIVQCSQCHIRFAKKPCVARQSKGHHFCCREHMIGFTRSHAKQWPTEDITSEYGVILYWTRLFYKRDAVHGRTWAYVPVMCLCKKERFVSAWNAIHYKYKGMCPECIAALRLNAKPMNKFYPSDGHVVRNGYVLIHAFTLTEQEVEQFKTMLMWTSRSTPYISEHRLVMARYLGRALERKDIVHHRNGIRSDNRLENLELTDSSSHQKMDHKYYALWIKAIERIQQLEFELSNLSKR